jgi:hypothetical protein
MRQQNLIGCYSFLKVKEVHMALKRSFAAALFGAALSIGFQYLPKLE